MLDNLIEKYRWYIGGILILIILFGVGTLIFQKVNHQKTSQQSQELQALKDQNDLLRQELSQESTQNVAGAETSADNEGKININTASATELDVLPNIGAVRAADIISYRETNGPFQTIEEIKNIKGIGDKSFEELKDLITTGQ